MFGDPRLPASFYLRELVEDQFDGNHGDFTTDWLYAKNPSSTAVRDDDLIVLMRQTVDGNLSWLLIPPKGFRV